MAKAAAQLNLTQSGVSKAIAELEHTFGIRLFDRTAQGAEPTLYGRALLKGGAAVFDELRQSINTIEHLADPTTGELRIGCTEPMAWGLVPQVIDHLVRQYPRFSFHVTQSDPGSLRYRDLPERKVELAIGRLIGSLPDDTIHAEVLYHEKVFVVAGAQSPWAARRKIKLAELVNESWTLPTPDGVARSILEEAFQASGLPPPRVNTISFSIPLHNALLASGNFLGVLPRSLLYFGANLVSFKVLPLDLPARPGPVGIMTLKNRTPSPLAQFFIDHVRDITKSLARKM
jgi:DNA-binding transcriptional LysR family regulator